MNKFFNHKTKDNSRNSSGYKSVFDKYEYWCEMAVINKCDLRTYRRDAYCRIRSVMRLGDTQGTGQISSRVLCIILAIHSKER